MAEQSGFITKIYKARKNILDILRRRGFNITNYEGSSMSEVNIMFKSQQLDMLVEDDNNGKKAYIKFYLNKTIRPNNVYDFAEDLFNHENILTPKDDLIIIYKDKPNESVLNILKQIWEDEKRFISIINIHRLQFNILNHSLVPPHRVLSEEEKMEVYTKYNITDDKKVPEIGRFDPVANVIGIRPGELCEILRPSKTAINTKYYRICSS